MFSYATAIARILNLEQPLFTPGINSGQQLQSLNQALDKIWTFGQFDGLLQDVSNLTTSGGILTLPPQYRLLTGLKICGGCTPCRVTIKNQQWKFSPSANGRNWLQGCCGPYYAFDLGDRGTGNLGVYDGSIVVDQVTGIPYQIVIDSQIIGIQQANITPPSSASARQYQIGGQPSYIDTLSFNGMAKLRYIYATNTAAIVAPDSFEGLLMAVRSLHSYATGDTDRANSEFQTALEIVERDLGQVLQDEDMGRITVDYEYSGGSILNIM